MRVAGQGTARRATPTAPVWVQGSLPPSGKIALQLLVAGRPACAKEGRRLRLSGSRGGDRPWLWARPSCPGQGRRTGIRRPEVERPGLGHSRGGAAPLAPSHQLCVPQMRRGSSTPSTGAHHQDTTPVRTTGPANLGERVARTGLQGGQVVERRTPSVAQAYGERASLSGRSRRGCPRRSQAQTAGAATEPSRAGRKARTRTACGRPKGSYGRGAEVPVTVGRHCPATPPVHSRRPRCRRAAGRRYPPAAAADSLRELRVSRASPGLRHRSQGPSPGPPARRGGQAGAVVHAGSSQVGAPLHEAGIRAS